MLVSGHSALASLDVPKDLLMYSEEEFEERAQLSTSLCNKVKHQGIKLYARA